MTTGESRRPLVAGLFAAAAIVVTGILSAGCSGAAGAVGPTPTGYPGGQAPVSVYSDSPTPAAAGDPGSSTTAAAGAATLVTDPYEAEDLAKVELLQVALAADGAYVMVQFRAPARLVRSWQPGQLSVTDEATSTVYKDIPTVPVLGALFGRPVEDGQIGYVMLSNLPQMAPGTVVTVDLGGFRREHVRVE